MRGTIEIAASVLAALLALGCGGANKPPAAEPDVEEEGEEMEDTTSMDDLVAPEKLDAIQRYFVQKRPLVAHCYSAALENQQIDRKATGRVTLALKVGPGGAPAKVHVTETTLRVKVVEECVVDTVSGWTFPAPGQTVDFSFSYDFEPE